MNKCFLDPEMAKILPECHQENWPNYAETIRHVELLFVEPVLDFDLIQRAEQELGFSEAKFTNGVPYFYAWYLALENVVSGQIRRMPKIVAEWKKTDGETGYAKLAEAMIYLNEAWVARGEGYANTVSEEANQLYLEKLAKSNETLDMVSDKIKNISPWYELKLKVALQHPALRNTADKLFHTATDRWPDHLDFYSIPMHFALPIWGGSFEKVDKIARHAVQKNGEQGTLAYAKLYKYLFSRPGAYTLADSKADWKLIKQGFRKYEESNGLASLEYISFAKLACQMRDQAEAKRLYGLSDRNARKTPEDIAEEATDACRIYAMR